MPISNKNKISLNYEIIVFSAKCNIYISHLCYDVSVRLSVRLSVTFMQCGHRVQWILDIFACLDRWMSLLLTDNASPGSSDGMMPGFLVEVGYRKIGNCSDITYFTYWESGPETHDMWICLYQQYVDIFIIVRVISVENALYLKNGLC